jgi:ABC-2 type transport system permease protein
MTSKTASDSTSEEAPAAGGSGASVKLKPVADFRFGWLIVARKELADHLLSVRFGVLLVLLAVVGLGWVNAVAGTIRGVAEAASETDSVFLLLYTEPIESIGLTFLEIMGFLTPLLGLAFGFTAINSERTNRTLPRLVSQPIHRDDVITGKFAAGLSLITLAFVTLLALLCGYGIIQLGITPGASDLARLFVFAVIMVLYIGVWLALGILLSVLTRSAVTAVLAGIALWLVLTLFFPLISGLLANALSPADETSPVEDQIAHLDTERWLNRISPQGIYDEASLVMLRPTARSSDVLTTAQADQFLVFEPLATEQSVLLIWPQIAALLALTVVLFAAAFIQFLQQEVRA